MALQEGSRSVGRKFLLRSAFPPLACQYRGKTLPRLVANPYEGIHRRKRSREDAVLMLSLCFYSPVVCHIDAFRDTLIEIGECIAQVLWARVNKEEWCLPIINIRTPHIYLCLKRLFWVHRWMRFFKSRTINSHMGTLDSWQRTPSRT